MKLYDFFLHLSLLLKSGVSLRKALTSLQEESPGWIRKMIGLIEQQLIQGRPFTQALGQTAIDKKRLITSVLSPSEESGSLPEGLEQIGSYLKDEELFRRKIYQAVTLPLLIIGATLLLILLILFCIVPHFQLFLQGQQEQLPALTRYIFHLSDLGQQLTFTKIGGAATFTALSFFIIQKRSPHFFQTCLKAVPKLGHLVSLHEQLQFFASWRLQERAGVSLHQIMNEHHTDYQMTRTKERLFRLLSQGTGLSDGLKQADRELPEAVFQMVQTAERSGNLSRTLDRINLLLSQIVSDQAERCVKVITPAVLIIAGGLITLLILAVYLPIFALTGQIGSF